MEHIKLESDVFFAKHPVFTTQEFEGFLKERGQKSVVSSETRQTLLKHHLKRKKILRIRRGLYATIPAGQNPDGYPVDSFLVAAHLTQDSVLAYHTALSLNGIAQSVREERTSLSLLTTTQPFCFGGISYRTLPPPTSLPQDKALTLGVETIDRQGVALRVTNLERTLVDTFDRLALSGGWEEVWQSLGSLDVYLDVDFIVRYVSLLENATTAGKVGCFLEAHQKQLGVPVSTIEKLKRLSPKQPHYVERGRRYNAHLIADWNLLIPGSAINDPATSEEDIPV